MALGICLILYVFSGILPSFNQKQLDPIILPVVIAGAIGGKFQAIIKYPVAYKAWTSDDTKESKIE